MSGLLITLGVTIGKVTTIDNDLQQFKARYAAEVVPRQEHIQMNNVTEERWKAVGDRLTHVEQQLENIQSTLNIRR